jgi:hypothetical protein
MTYELATCGYFEYRPSMGVPVPTSLGVPDQFKRYTPSWTLKPKGVFNVYKTKGPFQVHYMDRLDAKGSEIAAELRQIADGHGNDPLVLLCWCDLSKAGGWCHRRMAAAWLEQHTGTTVPELGSCRPANLYPDKTLF